MNATYVELAFVLAWSVCALAYLIVRERRWRVERRVLCEVLDNSRAELERVHGRCTRGERERTRILCAVHKFQHANPKLAEAIDLAIGEEGAN